VLTEISLVYDGSNCRKDAKQNNDDNDGNYDLKININLLYNKK